MPQIRLEGVTKYYKNDKKGFPSINDVNLTVDQGEFLFIVGSSGSGKSTLLELMAGVLRPSTGNVYLDHIRLSHLSIWRRHRLPLFLGYVPQFSQLIRKQTIGESLILAAVVGQKHKGPSLQERIQKVLHTVGLPDVTSCYPVDLSLAECRRVELACAMINSPPILIIDELTADLDEDATWDIMHLLNEINHLGTTVIMATHARKFVNIYRKRVITLVDGRVLGDVSKGRYGDI